MVLQTAKRTITEDIPYFLLPAYGASHPCATSCEWLLPFFSWCVMSTNFPCLYVLASLLPSLYFVVTRFPPPPTLEVFLLSKLLPNNPITPPVFWLLLRWFSGEPASKLNCPSTSYSTFLSDSLKSADTVHLLSLNSGCSNLSSLSSLAWLFEQPGATSSFPLSEMSPLEFDHLHEKFLLESRHPPDSFP